MKLDDIRSKDPRRFEQEPSYSMPQVDMNDPEVQELLQYLMTLDREQLAAWFEDLKQKNREMGVF